MNDLVVECERPGRVAVLPDGSLDIDVPAGCTVWLKRELIGPVTIEYDATAIAAGGSNDRVSDLNCFWMATDPAAPDGCPFANPRSGAFGEYDTLRTYYVGVGGNGNTTTRFRRYVGQRDNRPLLPAHDLREPRFLLTANRPNHLRLVADGRRIEFWRDGERLFSMEDSEPYTRGWFAIRTVASHLRISNLRISAAARAAAD